jgi:hypothetical protein
VNTAKSFLITIILVLICARGAIAKVKVSGGKKYTIDNIKIYSKSDNASIAKELALKDGERTALKELFGRIGINKSYTKYINDGIIADMVATIKISDEVITNDSYSGIITVVFDTEFVRYNLDNLGIKAGKVINDVILYIPIFIDDNDSINILDNSNSWYQAAYNRFFESNFEDIFIIDNYSLSNSGLLNKNKITGTIDYMSFETLFIKYASNVVLISLAKYNKNSDSVDIVLKEINAENTGEKVLNYLNKGGLPKDKFIENASTQLFDFISRAQKAKKAANYSIGNLPDMAEDKLAQNNYVDLLVSIPNLREFVFIKNLIIHFNFIKSIEILELTRETASIRVYYICNENELVYMFRVKNFDLNYRNGQHFLSYQHNDLNSSPEEYN